jgi:nitroreductase
MELYECIKTRRSIRKYLDKEVPWDLVSKIVDAGRLAPSAGNLQNWKFVVVLDDARREKIAEACLNQTWMNKAPVHIIVLADPRVAERYYGARGDRLYSVQNCAAAIENMLLMAHNVGLGACWVGALDENMVGRTIKIPEGVRPQAIITLGYPGEKVKEPAKYPLENVTYFNGWRGKIRNVPQYMGYHSINIQNALHKGKRALKKKGKELAEKSKEVAGKIKKNIQEKNKKRNDFKKFKKIHGLK